MAQRFLMEYVALSLYALFVGFCFCDGFKLHIARKLLWFVVFAAIGIYILQTHNEFDLAWILPVPSLLAILLCRIELRRQKKNAPAKTA